MEEKKLVPKLRFPGFTEPWEQRKLGEMASFSKGNGYFKSDLKSTGIPIILYGRLYTKYETVIEDIDTFADAKEGAVYSLGGEVIVPASGETAEDISIASVVQNPGVLLGGDLNIIRPIENLLPAFLALSISNGSSHREMSKRAQGKSVVHLHNEDLAQIDLKYPSVEEQSKITACINWIDTLITLHQRKLEHLKLKKKSLLQKLFPKEGEVYPEIRFPGFTDPWEQRKLGEITVRVKGNDGRMDLPTLTISAAEGWLDQHDRFSTNIAGNEQKNYTLLHRGELSYNHGNSKNAKYGVVFVLSDYTEALVPKVYHSFKVKNNNYNPYFIEYYFATKRPDKELCKLISSGARMDGLLNIGYEDFVNIAIKIPLLTEQSLIVECLNKVNTLLTLHQRKLEHLQLLKKALLQQLFV